MKEYYHDSLSKTLSVAPTNPNVTERTDSRGNTTITVTAFIGIHCFNGKNGPEIQNRSHAAKDFYTSHDTPERAVSFFKSSKYPRGEKISAKEYFDLYRKYEDELTKGPK